MNLVKLDLFIQRIVFNYQVFCCLLLNCWREEDMLSCPATLPSSIPELPEGWIALTGSGVDGGKCRGSWLSLFWRCSNCIASLLKLHNFGIFMLEVWFWTSQVWFICWYFSLELPTRRIWVTCIFYPGYVRIPNILFFFFFLHRVFL